MTDRKYSANAIQTRNIRTVASDNWQSLLRTRKRLALSIRKRTHSKPWRWWVRYLLTGECFKLISQSAYLADSSTTVTLPILPAKLTPIDLPAFSGYRPPIDTSPRSLHQPEVAAVEYRDARALAASDFVLKDGECVHPDFYLPIRDVTMSERFGQIVVLPKKAKVKSCFDRTPRANSAISLLGQSAGNYAHFLTEILPKLPVIDQIKEYAGIPILVDSWVDQNILKAIKAFNTTNREVIEVHVGSPIYCKRLVTLTPHAYAPPEYRLLIEFAQMPVIAPETYRFNVYALNCLREKAWSISDPAHRWIGKKMYLRRHVPVYGNGRRIVNAANVEDFAQRAGFDFIETGSLTIQEQIAAFRDAEEVMAPVGASLANLVFTKPGCKVTCLAAHFEGGEYDYWSTLMAALGHSLQYVVGPQIPGTGNHPLHRDYRIPMDELAAAIAGG